MTLRRFEGGLDGSNHNSSPATEYILLTALLVGVLYFFGKRKMLFGLEIGTELSPYCIR